MGKQLDGVHNVVLTAAKHALHYDYTLLHTTAHYHTLLHTTTLCNVLGKELDGVRNEVSTAA